MPDLPLLCTQSRLALQLTVRSEVPRPLTEHVLEVLRGRVQAEHDEGVHVVMDLLRHVLREDDVRGGRVDGDRASWWRAVEGGPVLDGGRGWSHGCG